MIWSLLCLEWWQRLFVDNDGAGIRGTAVATGEAPV
jgi:hypothetical protein